VLVSARTRQITRSAGGGKGARHYVDTHPVAKTSLVSRCAAAGAALLAAAVLLTVGGTAAALPQPTVPQVQAKLKALNYKQNWLTQQYDQATADLASARERLALVNREVTRDNTSVQAMRDQIAQIATNVYENGSMTSVAALLTSGDAQTLLGQSAFLSHLSSDNYQQLQAFITTNRQLAGARAMAKRTEAAVAALKKQLTAKRAAIGKSIAQEKTLLASLTPAQAQQAVGGGGTTSGGGGNTPAPASGQAAKAVAFARAQLGCTYFYGGTGPCHSPGFDCSGLTMSAWAYAGVSIPRTSYGQATLPQVSRSALAPGDIIEFAGESHVGIYVGGGMLIDAPTSGIPVEEVSLSSSWYSSEYDFAVRP
jgi:cell wall-associated NlpC family hydrolase